MCRQGVDHSSQVPVKLLSMCCVLCVRCVLCVVCCVCVCVVCVCMCVCVVCVLCVCVCVCVWVVLVGGMLLGTSGVGPWEYGIVGNIRRRRVIQIGGEWRERGGGLCCVSTDSGWRARRT